MNKIRYIDYDGTRLDLKWTEESPELIALKKALLILQEWDEDPHPGLIRDAMSVLKTAIDQAVVLIHACETTPHVPMEQFWNDARTLCGKTPSEPVIDLVNRTVTCPECLKRMEQS